MQCRAAWMNPSLFGSQRPGASWLAARSTSCQTFRKITLIQYNIYTYVWRSLRWKKYAPGPVRVISAAAVQSAQRIQFAANRARVRQGRPAAPLPPAPEEELELPVEDPPPAPAPEQEVLPEGRRLGCTRCRQAPVGCKQCRRPNYVPRGGGWKGPKGEGKGKNNGAAPKAKAKAKDAPEPKAKGRGRGRGRGRA